MYDYWRFGTQEFPVFASSERDLVTTTFAAPGTTVFSGEADAIGDIRSPYDLVEINLETVIENEAEFLSLRSLVDSKDLLYRRRVSDEAFEVVLARLVQLTPARVANFSSTVKVQLTFHAYIPVWLEFADLPWYFDSGVLFDASYRYFDECTYVEMDITSTDPVTFTIDNTDSEIDSGGYIVLQPSVNGGIDGFQLSTYENSFKFNDHLPSYETLYLDLDNKTVFEGAHTGYDVSQFTNGWVNIPNGQETYYVITCDAIDYPAKLYWIWRRTYL